MGSVVVGTLLHLPCPGSSVNSWVLLGDDRAGRLGRPEDIAAVVGLLCSDQGGFINGQLIAVNGGVVG